MNISQILVQVKSPFTDELIQKLIEKYISCGCDDNLFYREINNLGTVENGDNYFTNELIKYIFNTGVNKSCYYEKSDLPFFYESNDSWVMLFSEKDPLKEDGNHLDNKESRVYRFYLNIKGEEKSNFILNYMNKCKANGLPYKFKFSREDGRSDQIVILSSLENFGENFSIIEELIANLQLGNLPMLIGEYKQGIGITEEFYNRLYSPTKVKLALIRCSVKKYLCDHRNELNEILSDKDKKEIDRYIVQFSSLYDDLIEDKERKERRGRTYKDLDKTYYQRKSSIECAKEHIENDRVAYVSGKGLLPLGDAIKQIYFLNPKTFMQEIVQNFRTIGTQVWGLSEDFVFSNETAEMIVQYLKQREIELSNLEAKSSEYDKVDLLIGKLEEQKGQNIEE